MMNPDDNRFNLHNRGDNIHENFSFDFGPSLVSLEEQLKSPEEIAQEKLDRALVLNRQYQEKLEQILTKIDTKLIQNKEKIEKIDRIISFKNKRNKIQLKKKQIEFYQYEESKSSPEILRTLYILRNSKRKKNYSSLYKNLYQGSSSEEEEENEDGDKSDDSDDEKVQKEDEKMNKKIPLENFLDQYKGQDPKKINWIALAKRANSELEQERINQGNIVITGLQLYRKFIAQEIQKKRTTWTQEDDEKLKSSVEIHGLINWKQVANHIDGKNTSLCFQRWAKFVNPMISKGRWNLDEDIKLVLAVEAYKVGNWISIASLFKNRTDVQCRERWCNILDPGLHGSTWTQEEDTLLMMYVQMFDKKWARIAKAMKTRTDNQCWRRYKLLTKSTKKKIAPSFPVECLVMKIDMKKPFTIIRNKDDYSEFEETPRKVLEPNRHETGSSMKKEELGSEKKPSKKKKIV